MPVSASPADARNKWRRKAREPKITKRNRMEDDEDDDDDYDNEGVEAEEDEDLHPNPSAPNNPTPGPSAISLAPRETEVLSDAGVRISDFPRAVKRSVNRCHSSVLAIAALEKVAMIGDRDKQHQLQLNVNGAAVTFENISYGQLQALSAVPADTPGLAGLGEQEGSSSFVVTPPPIMEGRGITKKFLDDRIHVLPMHSDWFSPTTVHRLERQVVPQYFSGKSVEHTPEKYLECRNLLVARYMENPEKRLSISDCQGLAAGVDNEDLNRIFRFLDNWGIINYSATVSNQETWSVESYLREDLNGEVHVPSASLKCVDSLIKFDKPKCRLKPGEIYPSLPNVEDLSDVDSRIRERLSENCCCHCSRSLPIMTYQSLKDADTLLCSDCYHEGRFVVGHSSIDFCRMDATKDYVDPDGESWTDQETLLLLEALETNNDNWNEIAEHVGTKSKAQCILHFLRLPMEDDLLDNVEVPNISNSSSLSNRDGSGISCVNSNGDVTGSSIQGSCAESRIPFADSGNPAMSLVAFLASAVGPRVAAACAHASLGILSEDDRINSVDNLQGDARNPSQHREENWSAQGYQSQNSGEGFSSEKVKAAAKAGLAAAAMKAKLFADHEEREIQRLSANIVNLQLKRLELKLKQFAEVETLLMKECEQVEKARQRFAAERARVLASRFGAAGVAPSVNMPQTMMNANIGSNRQQAMAASPSQPSTSAYGSPQVSHPNMSAYGMSRPPMFSLGPRLPLSAIQPGSSAPSPNLIFSPQGTGQSSLSQTMLRPLQGTSSGHG